MSRRTAAFLGAIAVALGFPSLALAATKIACVGDSITFGYNLSEDQSYPHKLAGLLGADYQVENNGHSGATMLKSSDNSYWNAPGYTNATNLGPDIVVIMLGTNDSKPENWDDEAHFEEDYTAMVQHFRDLGAEVYIALPPPLIGPPSDWALEEVVPHVQNVAEALDAPVIDLHELFTGKPEDYADDIHPNDAGTTLLAQTVYEALTGDPAPGSGGASGDGGTGTVGVAFSRTQPVGATGCCR